MLFKCLFLFYFYNKTPKLILLSVPAAIFTLPFKCRYWRFSISVLDIDTRSCWFPSTKINKGLQATCLKAKVSFMVQRQDQQLLQSSCALGLKPLVLVLNIMAAENRLHWNQLFHVSANLSPKENCLIHLESPVVTVLMSSVSSCLTSILRWWVSCYWCWPNLTEQASELMRKKPRGEP